MGKIDHIWPKTDKKGNGDLAHELKCAQSQALTAEIRVEIAVKEAVEEALAAAPTGKPTPAARPQRLGSRRSDPAPEQKATSPPGEWLVAGGGTTRKEHIAAARMLGPGAVLESIARGDYDLVNEDEEKGQPRFPRCHPGHPRGSPGDDEGIYR